MCLSGRCGDGRVCSRRPEAGDGGEESLCAAVSGPKGESPRSESSPPSLPVSLSDAILSLHIQLTAPPVNTSVLAFLSSVAGDALTRHLGVILPALLSSLKGKLGTEDESRVRPPPTRRHHLSCGCVSS